MRCEASPKKWTWSTRLYEGLNIVVRIFLIVASGIVAAEKNLSGAYGESLVNWVPLLALAVTIVTALDSWLKPREKWLGFMKVRDNLSSLLLRAQKSESSRSSSFEEWEKKFSQLREQHRSKNVY